MNAHRQGIQPSAEEQVEIWPGPSARASNPARRKPTNWLSDTARRSSGSTTAATRSTATWWRCIRPTNGSPGTTNPGSVEAPNWPPLTAIPGLPQSTLRSASDTELLGGGEAEKAIAKAEKALQLARQSGMHAAIVISLNSLALTLADLDPARARALLEESVERSAAPGEASPSGILTACLVAGRLQDWDLTLALAVRSMHLERWIMAPLQVAPCLAMCARALAENRPEVAGVLHGAAYATFRRAASEVGSRERSSTTPVGPHANFVLTAMHETGDIVAAALGDERRRALRTEGAAMSMDEAITYALANIDHKLLNNPIASIDR